MEVYIVHVGGKEKQLAISSHNQVDGSFMLDNGVWKDPSLNLMTTWNSSCRCSTATHCQVSISGTGKKKSLIGEES